MTEDITNAMEDFSQTYPDVPKEDLERFIEAYEFIMTGQVDDEKWHSLEYIDRYSFDDKYFFLEQRLQQARALYQEYHDAEGATVQRLKEIEQNMQRLWRKYWQKPGSLTYEDIEKAHLPWFIGAELAMKVKD